MKRLADARSALVVLALSFAVVIGCGRKASNSAKELAGPVMAWTNQLDYYHDEILTGAWANAESCWGRLSLKRTWTDDEMARWIRFQTEILEQTRTDPLKGPLRDSAIQQIYYNSEAAQPYLGWLKNGLATNLFDSVVAQKARETVADMEKARK